jgi:putative Mg2+ transporter-C (MgtC) family protein
VTGAIGVAAGLGSYDVAVMLAIATVVTLWLMQPLKRLGHLSPDQQKKGAGGAAKARKGRRQG